jgi:hypothetical protein
VKSRARREAVGQDRHYCLKKKLLRQVILRKIKTGIFVKLKMDVLKFVKMVG